MASAFTVEDAHLDTTALRTSGGTGAKRRVSGLFLLPVTWVILGILVLAPAGFVVLSSVLADPTNPAAGFSLQAIKEVFATPSMLVKLLQTVVFAVAIAAITTVIATLLSWSTTRLAMRGARIRETLIVASLYLSPFIAAVAWIWLGTRGTGLIDKWEQSVGIPGFLQPDIMSVGGMVFILVTHYVPYAYMFISSSMAGLDTTLEEASLVNGRGYFATSLRVSFPMLRPAILSAGLFVAILAMGEFTVPSLLGQTGAFTPLSSTIYNALNGAVQNIPLAGAISTELLIVCLAGLYLYQRSIRASSRYTAVSGKGRRSDRIRLSRATSAIVWILTLIYGVFAFLLPLATLVVMSLAKFLAPSLADMKFSAENLWQTLTSSETLSALGNSLILALVVPIVCIALGILIVYLSDRARLPTSRAMTYVATAPMALPGLVIALGVLLLYIRTPLYLTLGIIVIGLVAISLTHAVRVVSNGFGQIDASLEEASQVTGASRLRTVLLVLVPLIRPSLYAAFSLLFVLTLRELNIPVLLYAPDTETLSVVAWNFSESSITGAAAIGLLQVVVMLIGMGLLRLIIMPPIRRKLA
ncbi:iron ABC transporter permease [Microbacterium horticulturae]|uniref:Iron ABC transporter permease n=1 Tax=Microbacterium horticulturae TaxID=3028316 RepID=A0ABY8BY29_9MICO|nr:iron ABC transporter permease [Microbacterium sp. KACC 23027]WEG08787.1 iron ABC transporter permease [Microbacterium sp. KACC 23027]